MTNYPSPQELAVQFSRVIREWLDDEMAEVVRRNAEPAYAESCATHDFCDANMAMQEALGDFGLSFEGSHQQELIRLINEAWDVAKESRFDSGMPAK